MAQGGDLAVHELRQRDGAGDGFEDVLGLGFLAFSIGLVQGVDEELLGICFWREGFEAAFGPDRMGEKGG